MSNHSGTIELDSLRQSIEALALAVALRDISSPEQVQDLSPMLTDIRLHAESAGMAAVAEAASVTVATEPALRDVISRMQQLVAAPESQEIAAPPGPVSLNQDPELVADFIMESREHLSAVETHLLALEHDPRNAEAINAVFRGFHTIKGLAGFLDFPAIQRFAHEVETLLDLARNSRLAVDSSLIDIILQSADHMNRCLLAVESGAEPASGAEPLIARIHKMIDGEGDATGGLAQLAGAVAQASPAIPVSVAANQESAGGPRSVKVDTVKLDFLVDMVGELVIAQSMIQHDPDMAAVHNPRLTRNLSVNPHYR